jgi:hypothetical protein
MRQETDLSIYSLIDMTALVIVIAAHSVKLMKQNWGHTRQLIL